MDGEIKAYRDSPKNSATVLRFDLRLGPESALDLTITSLGADPQFLSQPPARGGNESWGWGLSLGLGDCASSPWCAIGSIPGPQRSAQVLPPLASHAPGVPFGYLFSA